MDRGKGQTIHADRSRSTFTVIPLSATATTMLATTRIRTRH
jgi:hypothetical protein